MSVSRRGSHKDFFMKSALKERIIDIKLTKWPIVGKGNGKYGSDSNRFGNWADGVKIVFDILLEEAFYDKPGFVFVNRAIGFAFDAKHPLAANGSARYGGNKVRSLVVKEGIKFSIHSFMPIWIV